MRMLFTAPTPSSTIERSPHLRAPPLLQELQLPLPRRRDLVRPGVTKKACDSTKHLPRVSTGIMCHLKRRWTQKVTLWVSHAHKKTHTPKVYQCEPSHFIDKIYLGLPSQRENHGIFNAWLLFIATFWGCYKKYDVSLYIQTPFEEVLEKGHPNSHRTSRSVWLDGDWISGVCFKGIKTRQNLSPLLNV